MTGGAAGLAFRPDLQGLRALAIVLVVLGHAGFTGFRGGFIGVDVFFVLSGYLISGLLLRERMASGRIAFAAFVARRLQRLLPALLAMLVGVMVLAALLLSGYEFVQQTGSAPFAASWTSNLYFAFTTFDYFAELKQRDLFLHTWSLGVEEQFYLAWPWLTLLVYAVATRAGTIHRRRHLLALCVLVLLPSLALSLFWSAGQSLWAFYLTPARVWQFALGALVFIWTDIDCPPQTAIRRDSTLQWLMPWFGLMLIVGSAVALHPGLVYPGYWALLPSIGAALIILAGAHSTSHPLTKMLGRRGAVWLGDRSYSLYLWHWPILMLGFAWGLETDRVAVIALVGLSVLLSMASYRWVELPLWKGRFRRQPTWRTIGSGVGAIVLVAATSVQLDHLNRSDESYAARVSSIARDDFPPIYRNDCDSWYRDAVLKPCVAGNPAGARTVVLLGDSVGTHWYSVLPATFAPDEWRIIVLTKSACAMVDEDFSYDLAGGIYQVCRDWREAALDYLQQIQPDIVFVGSASTYAFDDSQWVQGSRRVFERLASAADAVVVIAGTPLLTFDGPGCVERRELARTGHSQQAAPLCRESIAGKPAQKVVPLLAQATAPLERVHLLDLNDLVCPQGMCAARCATGTIVYRDQRHLTDSFVRTQAPAIAVRLRALGLPGVSDLDD